VCVLLPVLVPPPDVEGDTTQVNDTRIGYLESARAVIATDGLRGLFGRGLKTRILANGLQGLMFSILWKLFLDLYVVLLPALLQPSSH
jgi:hypothetical protein